jgi:hypothetical protein
VVAVLSLAAAGSTLPTATAQPAKPRPLRFGAGTVADFLFSLAKEPLKNFVMDQIGLPTSGEAIKRLEGKVDALRKLVEANQVRITAQVAEFQAQTRLDYLKDLEIELLDFYTEKYIPLVASAAKVKEAEGREPYDATAVSTALESFNKQKWGVFLANAATIKLTTLAQKIHARLQPDTGEGILRQYGRIVMIAHRELTTPDSQRVIGMYERFEELQALATWMSIETYLATGGASVDLIGPKLQTLSGWIASQRDGFAPNGLHAPIPDGVVIDRGPDADANTYTTVGKSMFANAGTGFRWIPTYPPPFDPNPPSNVPGIVKGLNDQKFRGFQEWAPASADQFYGLFALLPARNRDAILAYLRGLFGEPALDPGSFIWLSDFTDLVEVVPNHWGVSMDTLDHQPLPYVGARYNKDIERAKLQFEKVRGGLLVARPTGDAQYLP